MADWQPMTEEQRQRWKDTGLFPVERWGMGQTDATPLVCPLPDRALLRALAEAIPSHIQSSGWYATGQRYEARTVHSVYGDNFRGMGRQAIASVISVGNYSGPLADYIAAACPRTVLRLLDRIQELERAQGAAPSAGARPLSEWHEDDGPVTWWKFPVDEPAWIGTPNSSDWPGYHTHWTPHPPMPLGVPGTSADQSKGGR